MPGFLEPVILFTKFAAVNDVIFSGLSMQINPVMLFKLRFDYFKKLLLPSA